MSHLFTTLSRTAVAAVAALGIALPAPARAGDDDLVKGLIAVIAVGALIHAIDKGNAAPKPAPKPVALPRVPAECAIRINGQRRSVTVYAERCVKNTGFAYRLPAECANTARIYGRNDRVYEATCLRNAGFRL